MEWLTQDFMKEEVDDLEHPSGYQQVYYTFVKHLYKHSFIHYILL